MQGQPVLGRALTTATASALYPLGMLYFDFSTGKGYRYVEADGACINDTIAAKESLSWMDDGFEVTNDVSAGLGVAAPAGVAIAAIPEGYFGWIQVSGQAEMIGDGSVAAGECVVLDAVDGGVDTMAAGEEHQVFAIALEADAATTNYFTGMLRGLV